jgi:maltooligosyltrehalose trehalohydrolase
MPEGKYRRRRPIGAETVSGGGVHFRVWAPIRKKVEVVIEFEKHLESPMSLALEREHGGYFSGFIPDAEQGTLYRYRLDDEPMLYPDPASRYQPAGPHGPSEVIDPAIFKWTDDKWRGLRIKGQVIYEMHVGTFTQEGTWNAAQKELPELADFGITVIEMMPAADFPGRFGWGYDGVNMFAPTRLYGEPDDLRMFINKAHELGMAVILDVVYNHFGPDGNYLRAFSPDYFTSTYKNEWGEPNNFDGPNSAAVREFFVTNACYWVDEFHLDGLRLDATQQMYDNSSYNILAEITESVRKCAQDRALIIIGENEPQRVKLI